MAAEPSAPLSSAFETLQRFTRRPVSGERCELCGAGVEAEHDHLVELSRRRLVCACRGCAILFGEEDGQRYKRVPRGIRSLPSFRLTDAQWESLLVPINMAFFFENSASGKMTAVYPSPAGATESLLPLETWREIAAENPELQSLETDVEALLVNRLGASRGFPEPQYFLLPIDQCYQLVGLVRANWRGLSGGEELWRAITDFFANVRARAGTSREGPHA